MADVLCPIIVGRDAELARLRTSLEAALHGEGGLVAITGEAGIGKSRTSRALIELARSSGAITTIGRAVPSGTTTPYRPITEALLHVLRDRELPSDEELLPWLGPLATIVPILRTEGAAGIADPSPALKAESVVQILARLGAERGLVVVIEDLHWADADTLSVVEYLGDNLDRTRVLCAVTARDEEHNAATELIDRMVRNRSILRLGLDRLDAHQVAQMVRACATSADEQTVSRLQRTTEGVPFLVEEMLASPGIPVSFRETVRARFGEVPDEERLVISTAAVLGRYFDWRLLADATTMPPNVIEQALESGVEHQLLRVHEGEFSFRHALTREAIAERLLPPKRRQIASNALRALDARHPDPDEDLRDLAADLALQCGDNSRAAKLLVASGRAALARGALATAIDTLTKALDLGDHGAGKILTEAFALAGRIDSAIELGERLLAEPREPDDAAQLMLLLTQAAVSATRWTLAERYLAQARPLLDARPDPGREACAAVLGAEVALAFGDGTAARRSAEVAAACEEADSEIRCHALAILGRVARLTDRERSQAIFEQMLDRAQRSNLAIWQVHAMHELGTIEMFDHVGDELLLVAKHRADEFGALSTSATIDLQLAAVFHCRFDLDAADRHAQSALELSERLMINQVRTKALLVFVENCAWRGDRERMEHFIGLAISAAPDDPLNEGFTWGARGMFELLHGDQDVAVDHLARSAEMLGRYPHAEPACFRALWPSVLASRADPRAHMAIIDARRLGVASFRLNAGLISFAEAILTGCAGDSARARQIANATDADFVGCVTWSAIARLLVAESASSKGWDHPGWWLRGAERQLRAVGLDRLARRCHDLTAGPLRWIGLGITPREAEVLDLVVQGFTNKEIAARLIVSPRTVEKHVESLLRKLGARSRTHLVGLAETGTAAGPT